MGSRYFGLSAADVQPLACQQ